MLATPLLTLGGRTTTLRDALIAISIVGPIIEALVRRITIGTLRVTGSVDGAAVARRVAAPPAPTAAGGTGHIGLAHVTGRAFAVGDLFGLVVRVVLVVGLEEIGGVEERALLESDVDECGLDAGKDRFYTTEIDVTDHPAMVGTIDEQLNEPIVLQDCDPRLARGAVDQDLALHADRLQGDPDQVRPPPKRGRTATGAAAPRGRP